MPDEDGGLVKPFSENWRGKTAVELEKMTGVKGFHFCHMSGFRATTETLESAIKIAGIALGDMQIY